MISSRVVAQVLVGAFLLGMVFWSLSSPSWEQQFKATVDALDKAHSFHVSILTKKPSGDSYEVLREANCPNDQHYLQRHYAQDGSIVPMEDIEAWSMGNKHVLRQNNSIISTPEAFIGRHCGDKQLLQLGELPNYQMILAYGRAERGSKKTVEGQSCRQWTVQMPRGGGWGDIYTMCVNENNLPVEVITADGGTVAHASHWNEAIELPQPPEVSVSKSN